MTGAELGGKHWKEINEGLYQQWLMNKLGERNGELGFLKKKKKKDARFRSF